MATCLVVLDTLMFDDYLLDVLLCLPGLGLILKLRA